jgi:hypothetical protein
MKGWEIVNNVVQIPETPCPGDMDDYYWDFPNNKWVFITDNMDMTWAYDRMFGYDSGPGERLRKESETITGKEWKMLNHVRLKGASLGELIADAKEKGKQLKQGKQ